MMDFFNLGCRGISFLGMGLLTLSLTSTSFVHAGAQDEARRYCSQYEASTGRQCHVEKCPCGVGEKKLQKFDRRGLKRAYCVCVSKSVKKANNREKAEQACEAYEARYGEECLVSSRNCPMGMIPVDKFRGGPGVKYSACRDKKGPERFKNFANEVNQAMPQALMLVNSYKAFFKRIHNSADPLTPLPVATQRILQRHFPKVNLDRVRIGHSTRATSAAITDCHKIYFKRESKVQVLRGGRITRLLLHELAHTEQCDQWGGRNRYAMKWFRNLAPGIVMALKKGEEKFGDRIHDEMPMENDAEKKAQSLCRGLSICVFD